MFSRIAWSFLWWKRGLSRYLNQLQEFSRLSPIEAREYLSKKLLQQIQYFGNREDALPEWKEAAQISDARELWRRWPSLPILTKFDIKSRFPPEYTKSRFDIHGRIGTSGGSTGEPTRFLHDSEMQNAGRVAHFYARRAFGWQPGMFTLCVWGSDADIGKRTPFRSLLSESLMNQVTVSGFRISVGTAASLVDLIRRHQPVALYGYTGLLEFVARTILERGWNLPKGAIRVAWNGAEMLHDEHRKLFRNAFGTPVHNLYGGREFSAIAFEALEGAPLRVLRPFVFAECVDQAGNPVQPGELGRLILTSTVCRGTPFLRYDIGDLARSDSTAVDESGITHISRLEGRTAELIRLPTGEFVSTLFWNHLFKDFSEIKQFQIVVPTSNKLKIRLVGSRLDPIRESSLSEILKKVLGEMPWTLDWVDSLPLTSRGKLLQVVHE